MGKAIRYWPAVLAGLLWAAALVTVFPDGDDWNRVNRLVGLGAVTMTIYAMRVSFIRSRIERIERHDDAVRRGVVGIYDAAGLAAPAHLRRGAADDDEKAG